MNPVHYDDTLDNYGGDCGGYDSSDLSAWFLVSGDMDDFIFYDEPGRKMSEK